MGLVQLKRWYLVALGVALVALAAARLAGVGTSSGSQPLSQPQMQALEVAALERLKFPSNFVRTNSGCMTGRCYVVATPASQVASLVPGIMRAHGMQPPGSFRADEPVAALRLAHWSTASRDPFVIACKTAYTPTHEAMTSCQDAARVGPTLVNVLVSPYEPCRSHACADPGKSEVTLWSVALPTGS